MGESSQSRRTLRAEIISNLNFEPITDNAEPSSTLHVGDDCDLYVGIVSPICCEGVEAKREAPKERMCAGQPDTNIYGEDIVQTNKHVCNIGLNIAALVGAENTWRLKP